MPDLIDPTSVPAGGGTDIAGYVGRLDTDESTVVLAGDLLVEHEGGQVTVGASQAVRARVGEWVR